MDPRSSVPQVPLHLTSICILSPSNTPLYVHSFTSEQDELRHYHLNHAAVDVLEERRACTEHGTGFLKSADATLSVVMTSTPTRPADSYLGLLYSLEDMAFYGFQTTTKLRIVLSVSMVDAMIKDADIVAIFRAVHNLVLIACNNPFLSLPSSFRAISANKSGRGETENLTNPSLPTSKMFATNPEEIKPVWLKQSRRFTEGIKAIGEMLSGGR
ncbi:hypothetical protein C347_01125 [Cryptococcus neoformans AD2-60a]|nr:hypothetical protein C347_01125 [Cryptococcus neoformans var. grubii AD2-60a]OXC86646.1 hypothetical protein C344_01063 [Cryptococcus neoformans var. grubii AD1-7a]OXH38155.1 hypothetical protein J005_01063 [Cryptococcus neoformans var. grubii]